MMFSGGPTRDHEPTAFEIYVSGFGQASYGAWWTGSEIIYESFAPRYLDVRQIRISPSAAQWRRFWRSINELSVWEWAPRYEPAERPEPTSSIRDGIHWSLTLQHAGKRVESSGDDVGPGGIDLDASLSFATLQYAISRLLGGRAFF